jgi:hypothetical protein
MSVEVYLVPFKQSFSLSRSFVQQTLAGSLFAEALDVDPTATFIPMENPIVTPNVMQFLGYYSIGQEPPKHIPDLIEASRYLNLPWMMYYVDPLYDYITDKVNWNSPQNEAIFKKAIQEDRVWVVGYYLSKGIKPQIDDLLEAIKAPAGDVYPLLLTYMKNLTPAELGELLHAAVKNGFKPGVDSLLTRGAGINLQMLKDVVEMDRADIFDPLLKIAQRQGSVVQTPAIVGQVMVMAGPPQPYENVLRQLQSMATTRGKPQTLNYLQTQLNLAPLDERELLDDALADDSEQSLVFARNIISNPQFDPNLDLEGVLIQATAYDRPEIIHRLLQDPRTRLTRAILGNILQEFPVDDTRESLQLLRAARRQLPHGR